MTRKDDIRIADALNRALPESTPAAIQVDAWILMHEITNNLVAALQRDNPRFDSQRFVAAVYQGTIEPRGDHHGTTRHRIAGAERSTIQASTRA
jgi:hypothetical protein